MIDNTKLLFLDLSMAHDVLNNQHINSMVGIYIFNQSVIIMCSIHNLSLKNKIYCKTQFMFVYALQLNSF